MVVGGGGWVVVVDGGGGWVVVVVVGGRVVVVVVGRVVVGLPPEVVEVVVGWVPLPGPLDPPEGVVGLGDPSVDAGVVAAGDWAWEDGLVPEVNGPAVLDPASRLEDPPPATLPAEAGALGAWLMPEEEPVVPEEMPVRSSPQSLAVVEWVLEFCTPAREADTEVPAPPRMIPTPKLTTAPAITSAVPRRRQMTSPTPREATAATRPA